jgi:hypothetical protein
VIWMRVKGRCISRLKQLSELYLYQHFCSNEHSNENIQVMPLEEVNIEGGENMI